MNKIVDFLNSPKGLAFIIILGIIAIIYLSMELLGVSEEKRKQAVQQHHRALVLECAETLTKAHKIDYNEALTKCEEALGVK